MRRHVEEALQQVPAEHRRRGLSAGVGAAIGGVVGSVLGSPIGAAVGASIPGALAVVATGGALAYAIATEGLVVASGGTLVAVGKAATAMLRGRA